MPLIPWTPERLAFAAAKRLPHPDAIDERELARWLAGKPVIKIDHDYHAAAERRAIQTEHLCET